MSVLVLGGASWNRMIRVPAFPTGPGTLVGEASWEAAGSTGIGKALALKALGHAPVLHAVLGDDEYGARVRAFLDARGIEAVIDESDAPTPHHVNLMDPSGERLSVFAEAGDPAPGVDTARLAPLISGARAIFVGITPSSRGLLEMVRAAPGEVLVDLHDWDGRDPWHRAFLQRADVVQLAEGRLADPRAVMASLAETARIVVLTRGGAGALVLRDGTFTEVPPAPARLVDSNGAGDVFSVALWHGLGQGMDLARAGGFAAVAASLAVESRELVPERLSAEAVAARLSGIR